MTDHLIKRTIDWVESYVDDNTQTHSSDYSKNPQFVIIEKAYSIRLQAENEWGSLVDVGCKYDHVIDAKNHAELLKKYSKEPMDAYDADEPIVEVVEKKELCKFSDWNLPMSERAEKQHRYVSDGEYWKCTRCNRAHKKDDSRVFIEDLQIGLMWD